MRYRIRSPTSFTAMAPRRRDGGPSSHDGSDAPCHSFSAPDAGREHRRRGARNDEFRSFRDAAGRTQRRLAQPETINTASGAERILEEAKIYQTTGAAVADLQRLYATTARVRDMEKPVLTPRALADALHGNSAKGEKSGILFGREAKGLHNDDVAISDAIIMVPVNSEHRSINLAQAVLLIGYEWFQQTAPETLDEVTARAARRYWTS